MIQKNDISILKVNADEKNNTVSVKYIMANTVDIMDFVIKDGKLQINSDLLPSLSLKKEVNQDIINAVIEATIDYISKLN